ncbi:uroporphyrinogen-III C-methyltransferase [Serpentinicella alkaliphila]|uniref:uroporphyrinogen-III C-methyltransferase n=1 Tax=Serpentinicella alkaliphila TaxID=1734049 RepID=A0A4R2TND2_9FIRM|nr:uroporphyrinogen-III C-methyltransferase [Serpentinicella alkaliphila]QUH27100.1 uroporphyrinogen-III C-methyltransferase [Serpentinicella alkaliphila]TCQ05228.1 uroporphyrinogen-III synthase /uroporphyrinogen-III C-methyltransferase [Serpentinicella alkaliphila]
MKGKVYLIGMGPGDPELITLKAISTIQKCDVLVYDRLVNPVFLELNKNAKKIYVGKSHGEHTKTQDEINELLVKLSLEGMVVGRLKGGDPFVFGRGGEEALYLVEHGIEYEIIPGITSSIAVPAYAGIPVTQRNVATSFHVITGHEHGSISNIEWSALAKLNGTLVFLMGVESINTITQNLIEMGKEKSCPAAVIMNGTRYNQVEVYGTLEDIALRSKEAGIESPSIIIIGEVVKLHSKIGKNNNRPLSGLSIIVTRPYDQSREFAHKLKYLGASVQILPCIHIEPEEVDLDEELVKASNAFLFSSKYGVRYFIEAMKMNRIDVRTITGKIFGVGTSILEEFETHGIFHCIVPDVQNAEEAIKLVRCTVPSGSRVLIVRGNLGDEKLYESLSNYNITQLKVYKTVEGCNEEAFKAAEVLVFTSPSCVRGFLHINSIDYFRNKQILCIGKSTEREALEVGFTNVIVPKRASEEAMLELLLDWRKSNV